MGEFDPIAKDVSSLAAKITATAKSLQRQRDFIAQVAGAVEREPPNVSALRRLLRLPVLAEVRESFPDAIPILAELDRGTEQAWRELPLSAVAQFRSLATDAGLEVQGQAPKLSVGRGIEVTFRINENKTVVNGVAIQTVDPRDVFDKVRSEHERLWSGSFDAETFIKDLHAAYEAEIEAGHGSPDGVPILGIFERMQGSLSTSAKKAFGREVFAAQVSRAVESGARAPGGRALVLSPVAAASDALWIYLADRNERAYRGLVSFREGKS